MSETPQEVSQRFGVLLKRLSEMKAERDELVETLKALMVALTPELTGAPKNIPKSRWAGQWDAAEMAIKAAEGR